MPINPKPGSRQTNLELPIEVLDRAKEFAKSRGESLVDVVVAALLRHMANPPPLPQDAPLPPVTAPKKKGKK
jgi:hypothetical protein